MAWLIFFEEEKKILTLDPEEPSFELLRLWCAKKSWRQSRSPACLAEC